MAIDSRAQGVRDNRVRLEGMNVCETGYGDMERLPFREGHYYTTVASGGSVIQSGILVPQNGMGTGTGVIMSTTTTLNSLAMITTTLPGSRLGISFERGFNNPNQADFAVEVDGINYRVPIDTIRYDKQTPLASNSTILGYDGYHYYMFPDDFEDKDHTVEIICKGSTAAARSWQLYGWLVEKRCGFSLPTRLSAVTVPILLTTTPMGLSASSNVGTKPQNGLSKLIFTNITNVDANVSILRNTSVMVNMKVPANDFREYIPAIPWTPAQAFFSVSNTGIFVQASALNSINMTIEEAL